MKKVATLLAGMLLVTGQVMSMDNWDFTGSYVEWETKLLDSSDGYLVDSSEADVVLDAKWNVHENFAIGFSMDTGDDSQNKGLAGDSEVGVSFKYHNNDDYEMSIALLIRDDQTKLVNGNVVPGDGLTAYIDEGSDSTYIKWKLSNGAKIGFYPYSINTDIGNNLPSIYTGDIPGVVYEANNFLVGLGNIAHDHENVMTAKLQFKGEYDKLKYGFAYNGAFGDVDGYNHQLQNGNGNGKDYIATEHVINANAKVTLTKTMSLDLEAGYTMSSDTVKNAYPNLDDSGFGAFARLNKGINEKVTLFGAGTYISESFLYDDDPSIVVEPNGEGAHGGYTKVEAGADYKVHENITTSLSFEYKMTENEVYQDKDGVATDNYMGLSFKVTGHM